MRFLFTGPRLIADPDPIASAIALLHANSPGRHTLVHGDCPNSADHLLDSADQIAAAAASDLGWTVEAHGALWDLCGDGCPPGPHRFRRTPGDRYHPGVLPDYCPKAGPRRNELIIGLGADQAIAALTPCEQSRCRQPRPHWTHGTAGCMRLAQKAGIPVLPVHLDIPIRRYTA